MAAGACSLGLRTPGAAAIRSLFSFGAMALPDTRELAAATLPERYDNLQLPFNAKIRPGAPG